MNGRTERGDYRIDVTRLNRALTIRGSWVVPTFPAFPPKSLFFLFLSGLCHECLVDRVAPWTVVQFHAARPKIFSGVIWVRQASSNIVSASRVVANTLNGDKLFNCQRRTKTGGISQSLSARVPTALGQRKFVGCSVAGPPTVVALPRYRKDKMRSPAKRKPSTLGMDRRDKLVNDSRCETQSGRGFDSRHLHH